MIQDLYTLTAFSADAEALTAQVTLNKAHDIFNGHFPGNPVLPGVCTLQIIKALTEKALDTSLFLESSSNIKFMALINPETNPILDFELQYSSTENDRIKVKGMVKIEGAIALKLSATFKILGKL